MDLVVKDLYSLQYRAQCILLPLQSTCFYKHPPEARGAPKPPPGQPTAADIAAKAAAWRAINAASLQGQSSPASRADAAAPPTAVDISNGFSYAPAEKAPSSHADQAATDSAEAPAWGDEAAAQSARPNGTSCSNSCNRSEEVYQQPAAAGEDGAPLGAERARSGVLEEIARSSATGDVARSGVCAGGARSGESGQIARSGVRASPDLAARHAASYAARAVRRGPAKRNKVKNRFRAGVFRRFPPLTPVLLALATCNALNIELHRHSWLCFMELGSLV